MAAASSSASTASGSFGRLLKSSKVVSQYDPAIPLVYTTYGGSKRRSDYGLKRALPEIKTPAIRVHSLDNRMTKLTDFSYAAREHQFVKRFLESGVKVGGPGEGNSAEAHRDRIAKASQQPGASAWDVDGFESVQDLQERARTGQSKSERKRALAIAHRREAVANELLAHEEMDSAGQAEAAEQAGDAVDGQAVASTSTISPQDAALSTISPQDAALSASTASQEAKPAVGDLEGEGLSLDPEASQEPSRRFPPDYVNMTSSEFERFLKEPKTLRPQFLEYLRTQMATNDGPRQFLRDVYRDTRTLSGDRLGALVDGFLTDAAPALQSDGTPLPYDPALRQQPQRNEHIGFGLTYAPPNLYMSDRETKTLPARWLDAQQEGKAAMGTGGTMPTTVLGTVQLAPTSEIVAGTGHTQWNADQEGNINMEFGRREVRVESAWVRHPAYFDLIQSRTHDRVLYGVDVEQADNAYKRPTILDTEPVHIDVYRAELNQGSLQRQRIGSKNWVAQDVSTRSNMTQHIADGNVSAMFYGSSLRPPDYNKKYIGDARQKDRKEQARLQAAKAKAQSSSTSESPLIEDLLARLTRLKDAPGRSGARTTSQSGKTPQ